MFLSPLRYPGGKSKLTAYVLETIKLNGLEGAYYAEPFAGGCAIAWYLLLNGHAQKVYINDLDRAIYAFWHSVLNRTDELCELILTTPINIDEWLHQREIYRQKHHDYLKLGFATLFLNRTNRSGILNAGVIGGLKQSGKYKLDCRFNRTVLIKQISAIASRKKDIHLTNLDATVFIQQYVQNINEPIFVNIDPPYYVKGKGLYQNFFEHDDHYHLYENIKRLTKPWIITYDNTPAICDIYAEYFPEPFNLTYSAQIKRKGSEIIIHSPELLKASFKPDVTFNEIRQYYKQKEYEKFNQL